MPCALEIYYTVQAGREFLWNKTFLVSLPCIYMQLLISLVPRPHPQGGRGSGTHCMLSGTCFTNPIHLLWIVHVYGYHVTPRNSHLLLRVRAVDALSCQLHDVLHPTPQKGVGMRLK